MTRQFRKPTTELQAFAVQYGPETGGTASVLPPFRSELVGAGIHPRNPKRNDYRGMTITRPSAGVYVLGLAFDNLKDGHTDEDMYVLDLPAGTLLLVMPGAFESLNPTYSGTHRAPKPHLPLGRSGLPQILGDLSQRSAAAMEVRQFGRLSDKIKGQVN